MTARLILGNALMIADDHCKPKTQAPRPKTRSDPQLYTTVPGAIVPSFGTMMIPLRM